MRKASEELGVSEWMCISRTIRIADERGRKTMKAMKTDIEI